MGAPQDRERPPGASVPQRLRWDTTVIAVLMALLAIGCIVLDPSAWLARLALAPGWWLVGRVVFFVAASHLIMICFGARRGNDLKRELADRRAAQAQLRHQADHDELTGLRNRASYLRVVTALLATGRPAVVVLIDLDRFKEINDTLGHPVGDQLLGAVASRAVAQMPADGVLARLGGDEFALLLPGEDLDAARSTAHAMLETIRTPIEVAGLTLEIDASLGIAVSPTHGTTTADLLRRADVAMYAAKADQLGVLEFTTRLDEHDHARLGLYGELKRAVAGNELHVLFQPQVAMDDGRVVGVEALVRWRHPARGLLVPDAFLPVAERTGLVRPLTDVVLDHALRACRTWRDEGLLLPVAVNLSPRSLLDTTLPARVAQLLTSYGLTPDCLGLEVTEGAAMANPAQATIVLQSLSDLGLTLSIDDFGTGHASLAYLSRLPVDALKIDKGFVQQMDSNPADRTIVRSTIGLAHDLGLAVVAEGVETDTNWRALSDWGCDQAQGYWLSRPVGADEMVTCLDELAQQLATHPSLPRPRTGSAGPPPPDLQAASAGD